MNQRSLWLEQRDSTKNTSYPSLGSFHTHRALCFPLLMTNFADLITRLCVTFESQTCRAIAPRRSGSLSIYLDPFCAGLLQQFDRPCVRRFLTSAVVPGQVAASGATRQLVAQLLSRHRVLQGGTAKTEAGRRCEMTKRRGRADKGGDEYTDKHSLCIVFELDCHADRT